MVGVCRTKQWMATEDFENAFVYLPAKVAECRLPLGLPAGAFKSDYESQTDGILSGSLIMSIVFPAAMLLYISCKMIFACC